MLNRIVIIDDEPINCFIVEQMCKKLEFAHTYDSFTDVESALANLEQCALSQFPELIFLDLNMPVYSGWEFIDVLRDKLEASNSKIVILTSSMLEDDKLKAKRESLIHSYLIKPVETKVLAEIKSSLG